MIDKSFLRADDIELAVSRWIFFGPTTIGSRDKILWNYKKNVATSPSNNLPMILHISLRSPFIVVEPPPRPGKPLSNGIFYNQELY